MHASGDDGFVSKFRCQQVDEGRVEVAAGPHQCGDRQPAGPPAAALVHEAAAIAAAADGPRLRLRQEGQLLPAR
ncbi:hypothetical protein AVEN_181146-1 [Araneus ventricosus]|uniref:Uncharacterized protein n=1 Tax=Araneus ventricosus TaxID=182803 RepID=A0A4Y2KPJ5_ARAVE|nr:hypothetical protein AVEN_181146-1 [Araneus ventricosus]